MLFTSHMFPPDSVNPPNSVNPPLPSQTIHPNTPMNLNVWLVHALSLISVPYEVLDMVMLVRVRERSTCKQWKIYRKPKIQVCIWSGETVGVTVWLYYYLLIAFCILIMVFYVFCSAHLEKDWILMTSCWNKGSFKYCLVRWSVSFDTLVVYTVVIVVN